MRAQAEFEVEVFYDGACPLCLREIRLLRRLDRASRIRFTDIAAPAFDRTSVPVSFEALMSEIHGRRASGEWIQGVEVFRALYSAVGVGRLVAPTRWPVVRQALDVAYKLFAKNRLRMTGRCHDGLCEVTPTSGR